MLTPELLIKIILLPVTRISISAPRCAQTHTRLHIHEYTSGHTHTHTRARDTRAHTHTQICSCICTRHFYLAYSTLISLKWVKTK